MDIISKYAETLNDLMYDNKLTAESLSKATGISKNRIYEWLTGKSKFMPSVTSLLIIADYFKCSLDYLTGIDGNNAPPSQKPRPSFSGWFRPAIERKGFTLYGLGKKSNIATQHFYKWINNERKPSLDSLLRISAALNCSLDYLVGRE